MLASISNLAADFVSLLFPEDCLACEELLARGETTVCTACRISLPYTNSHYNNGTDNEFINRLYNKVPVKHALAFLYFTRSGKVQKLLHQLKYKGHQEVGELLGNWYGGQLKEFDYQNQLDIIVPVPLHPRKLKVRGYNQSDSFAEGLAQSLELPWLATALQRVSNSATQTKKSRLERWQNVGEIFQINDPVPIINKRILLVDDVMTTGATLEACALVLLDNGAQSVSIATIAAA